jgi:hypothetical protein
MGQGNATLIRAFRLDDCHTIGFLVPLLVESLVFTAQNLEWDDLPRHQRDAMHTIWEDFPILRSTPSKSPYNHNVAVFGVYKIS